MGSSYVEKYNDNVDDDKSQWGWHVNDNEIIITIEIRLTNHAINQISWNEYLNNQYIFKEPHLVV